MFGEHLYIYLPGRNIVLTDSQVTQFSQDIIKTQDRNLGTKLRRKPEQVYTIGTDLIYQIRSARNSPTHHCAIHISLHRFTLWGAGKKGHFFKEQ